MYKHRVTYKNKTAEGNTSGQKTIELITEDRIWTDGQGFWSKRCKALISAKTGIPIFDILDDLLHLDTNGGILIEETTQPTQPSIQPPTQPGISDRVIDLPRIRTLPKYEEPYVPQERTKEYEEQVDADRRLAHNRSWLDDKTVEWENVLKEVEIKERKKRREKRWGFILKIFKMK